jgi:hypothetical protein
LWPFRCCFTSLWLFRWCLMIPNTYITCCW